MGKIIKNGIDYSGSGGGSGGSYTAGNGIDITNEVISVDEEVVAQKSDLAGKQDAMDSATIAEIEAILYLNN